MKEKIAITFGLLASISLAADDHTNFVVIMMDDMGYGDLSYNGAIGYKTPNIDRMTRGGMVFTHFYAAQAVSGASRAGLLTGCYPNRIGMFGAPGPSSQRGINSDEETIAEVLKKKGYNCAIYGKWHLGHHQEFLPLQHGFDEYYGIPYSNDMWSNHPSGKFPPLPLIEANSVIEYDPDQAQFTTNFTNRAITYIEKNKDNPFFIYLAHPMPHIPLSVSDKFKGQSNQGLYGDVIMEIDWSVGEILNKLEKENLLENTIVIVMSDNGPWINYGNHAGSTGGLRQGKGTTFEGGQRVPCVIQWKGTINSGSICNQLASSIDLLPTFASIADAPLSENKIDGVNILPLLVQEEGANPRKSFYFYSPSNKNDLEAVTDGEFKLILPHRYRDYETHTPGKDGIAGKLGHQQLDSLLLIDLRNDPGERYNVIKLYPEKLENLKKIADEARIDLGDQLTGIKGKNVRLPGMISNRN